jgi:hypothetical protein
MQRGATLNLNFELPVTLDVKLTRPSKGIDLFGKGNMTDSAIALHENLSALHRDMEGSHVAQVNQ